MRGLFSSMVLVLISFLPVAAGAAELSGRVVAVADGDTVTLKLSAPTAGRASLKVRLAGIDAPESNQPFGRESRQALSTLVEGQEIRAVVVDTDRYGRTVAHLYVDTLHINGALVDRGAAWVYRAYNDDPGLIAREAQARAQRAGLWSLPPHEAQPPWEWRRQMRVAANDNIVTTQEQVAGAPLRDDTARYLAEVTPVSSSLPAFACRGKRTCGEMESCAEARFYLTQCGVTRLDGDKDGIPCESLCR